VLTEYVGEPVGIPKNQKEWPWRLRHGDNYGSRTCGPQSFRSFSGVRMEPGTLYGALSRLERRGWVRPLATAERRRPYQITAAGQEILAEQVTTMQQIVHVARLRTAMAWGA